MSEEVSFLYVFIQVIDEWLYFAKYLERLNTDASRQNKKVLSLLDNSLPRKSVELSHVKLLYFPRNTTSMIQSLDMGIIKAFKDHYRNICINSIGCNFRILKAVSLIL